MLPVRRAADNTTATNSRLVLAEATAPLNFAFTMACHASPDSFPKGSTVFSAEILFVFDAAEVHAVLAVPMGDKM